MIKKSRQHHPKFGAIEILKYIGPGLLVTVGFIDPGNWASNVAAGSGFGYQLLWIVTLSTLMIILLQHNVAHLGIATGDCLAEATMKHLKPGISHGILGTGIAAVVATAMAEILGGAIALQMLFRVPIKLGAVIVLLFVLFLLFSNTYTKLEKIIIGFVSVIGFSFLYELSIINIDWPEALKGWLTPCVPQGSMTLIMAVLGAVVMPHNLFLHSEIIQSRQWNKEEESVIRKQLKYEYFDTIFSMLVGWAINSAMIILAASAFFRTGTAVSELSEAQNILTPMLGSGAGIVFAIALLFSGVSSAVTAGMSGGTIVAGFNKEPYDIKDSHTKTGIAAILIAATVIIFLISDTFKALVISQMLLSIQLPITVFLQIRLTASRKVMGKYRNSAFNNILLGSVAAALTYLNIRLFISFF